jgi:cytochrome c553
MRHTKNILLSGLAGLALLACSPPADAPKKAEAEAAPAAEPAAPKPEPVKVEAPKVEATTPASTEVVAPKPPSAKRLYLRRTCMACHGKNGGRGIQDYPNIAGLDASYIRAQVRDIISGKRVGGPDTLTGHPRAESMRGSLVSPEGEVRVSPEEIKILASWLSDFPKSGPQVQDPALSAERIAEGKAGYEKAKCKTCHGIDGNKPLKGYPHLAGQKSAYIAHQLMDIRDGARTNSRSKMMLSFVKKLSDEEMAAIADYLSQVDPNQ